MENAAPVPPTLIGNIVTEDAVALVREILARVASGETVSVAIVEVRRDRTVSFGWAGPPREGFHYLNSGAAQLANALASSRD